MFTLEVAKNNKRVLKATSDGNSHEPLIVQRGTWIGGDPSSLYSFDKLILGPGNSIGSAVKGLLKRKLTGENKKLMQMIPREQCVTYYAYNAANVTVISLNPGERLSIESEYLLAFYNCDYDTRCLGTGIISQGGLFTTELIGRDNSQVAIITYGPPIRLLTPCSCDADAYVCHSGADPTISTDISIKTLLGQSSGETYKFEFTKPGGEVFVQPSERNSGVMLGID